MSLIEYSDIKRGNKIICDYYIDINGGNPELHVSPKIYQIVSSVNAGDKHDVGILLGVGYGDDSYGDPGLNLELGKSYVLNYLSQYPVILRLDSMGRYDGTDNRNKQFK
jgi:hypothetical protein